MFIKPMLAASMSESKKKKVSFDSGYVLEAKHDGMRAVASIEKDGVEVYSRVGKTYATHIPNLVAELTKLPDGTILDGELMVTKGLVDVRGKQVPLPDFNTTMRIMGSNPEIAVEKQKDATINYYVYDILSYAGEDLTGLPFSERSEVLRDKVKETSNILVAPAWGEWNGEDLEALMDAGIEGGILKNKDSVYHPGARKANTWYKVKTERSAEVVVVGFTDANEGKTGRWLGKIGAIRYGAYSAAGELVELGQCSGMTDADRDYWTDLREHGGWEGKVIEIKYNDLVGDGTPRHPQYKTERFDKNEHECTMEQFK